MVAIPDETVKPLMARLEQLRADRGGRLAIKAFSAGVDEHL